MTIKEKADSDRVRETAGIERGICSGALPERSLAEAEVAVQDARHVFKHEIAQVFDSLLHISIIKVNI